MAATIIIIPEDDRASIHFIGDINHHRVHCRRYPAHIPFR